MRSRGDDGEGGGCLADLRDEYAFQAQPAIRIGLLGLVHDLEEDEVGVGAVQVRGQRAPESSQALHAVAALQQRLLEVLFRVQVDDDRELLGVGLGDDAVQLVDKGLSLGPAGEPWKERIGVNAEADVVKAEMMDEGQEEETWDWENIIAERGWDFLVT